jgi:HEAT repeat protein
MRERDSSGEHSEPFRFKDPAVQTTKLEVESDATTGEMADDKAVGLLAIMLEKHGSKSVRSEAAVALGKIGGSKALAALKSRLNQEKEDSVKAAISKALPRGGREPAEQTRAIVDNLNAAHADLGTKRSAAHELFPGSHELCERYRPTAQPPSQDANAMRALGLDPKAPRI